MRGEVRLPQVTPRSMKSIGGLPTDVQLSKKQSEVERF
ncbi:hypothetical protein J2S19_000130 [Metabacillus malikii]|uniref:Uncharacterized protein n=1 Tax=Metabacillus malikii TaxID=1504265 RepID=A0ABT9Z9E4_9BACI|nr:hypothetical protein [Metabacillus malikii]